MMNKFKLKSGNKPSFKQMGSMQAICPCGTSGCPGCSDNSSPAKGLREDQVVDGQLCDAYGNPKPSQQEMQNMTKCPDFSNKAQKGKREKGLGPAFDKKKKKEIVKNEAKEKSGKEVDKKAEKALKKENDMKTMDEAIDATLGK